MNNKLTPSSMVAGILLSTTLLSAGFLMSARSFADNDSAVDQVQITVPTACTMSASGQTSHNATISPGIYSVDTTDFANGIGKTTLTTYCNDNDGFSVYAIGFTGNTEGNNTLVGTSASGNATIATKVYEQSDTTSNWSMKVNKVENPSQGDPVTWNPTNMTIADSFNNWHTVPDDYTKVAEYKASTGSSTTDTTLGAKLETTYATYISTTQPADTYTGQVKYVMVHPSVIIPNRLNVTYDANGLTFANGKSTNIVTYNATSTTTTEAVSEISRASYTEEGAYNNYSTPAGNQVVTINGSEILHLVVTYGVPAGWSGPPSELYIWTGNHPDYTNTNNDTSITSCGTIDATDGAFKSSGNYGSQVTMECDILSDSVTFYDYGSYNLSTGYYAVITGEGSTTTYNKTIVSGTYAIPSTSEDQAFLGWSTNPSADIEDVLYVDETDFITNSALTNVDTHTTLYAVWAKTLQGMTIDQCTTTPLRVVDSRDNTAYTIQQLADGRCWFLDNLALDLTNDTILNGLTVDNTNIDTTNDPGALAALKGTSVRDPNTDANGKYATAKITNWTSGDSYSAPLANLTYKDTVPSDATSQAGSYKVGAYYNFCAASAGSYCYGNGPNDYGSPTGNATSSICPKGWRLPTGGDNGEYKALYDHTYVDYRSALHLPLSGDFYGYLVLDQGTYGFWWSSVRYDSNFMNILVADASDAYPAGSSNGNRNIGSSVRCILDH